MIWIVGNKGMLGQEAERVFRGAGYGVEGTDKELDFTDADRVLAYAQEKQPAWVVNCAAYTAVDRAEDEPEAATRLNADGPECLARACAKTGARLIHVSTDYVFGNHGLRRPLAEDDPVAPESVYGSTKEQGERRIRETLDAHFIVRTAWLYGNGGPNFVFTMLRLFAERERITVVDDQWGSPTWAADLARVFLAMVRADSGAYGTYHYSGAGRTTWFRFAQEIMRAAAELGLADSRCRVEPCSSGEYPTKAKRPAWSVFSKDKIQTALGIEIPAWSDSLAGFLAERKDTQ